jgi:hypothetical protein
MNRKSILPIALLAAISLTSCDGAKTMTLKKYADSLPIGEVEDPVSAVAELSALLPAADNLVNRASLEFFRYLSLDYADLDGKYGDPETPYAFYDKYDGKRYDNNVLVFSIESNISEPAYDESTKEYDEDWRPDFTDLSNFKPYYSAEETLWQDETGINYVYDEDENPDSPFSFFLSAETNDEMNVELQNSIGASGDILQSIELADSFYGNNEAGYESRGWGFIRKNITVEKVLLSSTSNTEAVNVTYLAQLGAVMSYHDEDGVFYNVHSIEAGCSFQIVDGIVNKLAAEYVSYYVYIYEDEADSPLPAGAVDYDAFETYVESTSEVSYLGAFVFSNSTLAGQYSTKTNGNYNVNNLPDIADYHEGKDDDTGGWVNISLFFE